ncbi:MAG: hypothetical protein WDM76_13600 [Limisphaerales bacterium]
MADHQVAHIYLNDSSLENSVRDFLEKLPAWKKFLAKPKKSRRALIIRARAI